MNLLETLQEDHLCVSLPAAELLMLRVCNQDGTVGSTNYTQVRNLNDSGSYINVTT